MYGKHAYAALVHSNKLALICISVYPGVQMYPRDEAQDIKDFFFPCICMFHKYMHLYKNMKIR